MSGRRRSSAADGDVTETDTALLWILSWLAVHSDDTTAIIRTLGIVDASSCPVERGLYESGPQLAIPRGQTRWSRLLGLRPPPSNVLDTRKWFIAPPIDQWTLVFGVDIAFEDDLRAELSRVFGEAQAFHSDTKYGGYRWARSRAGETVRSVSVADDVVSEGDSSPPEPHDLAHANEYDVLRIARAFSVDPNTLIRAGAPGQIGTRRGR